MTIPHTQEQSPQLGTFKPVCHGHILFNTIRDRTVYFSLLFVFVPFLIVVCFNFKDLVSKTHWILVACLVILTVLTVIYLLRTWLTEPGILPKTQTNVIIDKVVPNEMQKRIATLMVSVKNDKKEYIERTLEIIPDAIHQTNIEGRTLLHIACIFDMENIAKVLLSYNPDIFQIDSFGLSAIHYSACFPNSKVFPLLCQFLQWESTTWENHKQELLKEVYQHIPQYSFEKNCYFIQTPDGVIENEDISAFFLPVPVSTLLQQTSSSSTNPPHIEVPYLCFICLSNHHIVNVLFCDSCKHFIPPRGFHCRKCDICIRTFDHHCPWMSNCIGLRNHSLFIWFLIWSVITCVVGVAVMSVYFISYLIQFLEGTEPFNFWGFVGNTWSCILYGCCCIGFIAPLVNLLLYHIQISLKNETTHEELMLPSGFKMRDKCENKEKYYPYSEGWKKNLKNALFCRIPSSLVNLQSTSV